MEWEFEDKMDSVDGLFFNGMRDTHESCCRESYGTCVDFKKLEQFLTSEMCNYTTEQWEKLHKHFSYMAYLSPMNGLVAYGIEHLVLEKLYVKETSHDNV